MQIIQLSIKNFKKFKETFTFYLSNQSFLVGENNTGKTTVIEAIDYLLNGPQKDRNYKNLKASESDNIIVEAVLLGDFKDIDKKYNKYIYKENDIEYLRIRRSDFKDTITQDGKPVTLDQSKILCWHNENQQFENPTGKDKTFNLLNIVAVYANDHVNNIISFDSTKILGKLIKSSVGDFFTTKDYKDFKDLHNKVFNDNEYSLKSRLKTLSSDISQVLQEQWGEMEISFNFDIPDESNYLKKGTVLIKEESSDEHALDEKGSGLQRSVMLSMIQVLSQVHSLSREDSNIILCIDEPELNLHPRAQEKLTNALKKISKNIQVIISTHSPFILKSFQHNNDKVYVFNSGEFARPSLLERVSVLPFGPTLAEIQYFAYKLTPTDLHNELYGYLESEKEVLNFVNKKEKWIKIQKDGTEKEEQNVSLQYYIRNSIHHPENTRNPHYTDEEIKLSIKEMIDKIILLENLNSSKK